MRGEPVAEGEKESPSVDDWPESERSKTASGLPPPTAEEEQAMRRWMNDYQAWVESSAKSDFVVGGFDPDR